MGQMEADALGTCEEDFVAAVHVLFPCSGQLVEKADTEVFRVSRGCVCHQGTVVVPYDKPPGAHTGFTRRGEAHRGQARGLQNEHAQVRQVVVGGRGDVEWGANMIHLKG